MESDEEWKLCLRDAVAMQMGILFVNYCSIVIHCNPTSPCLLWEGFKAQISEDILRRPAEDWGAEAENSLLAEQLNYNPEEEARLSEENCAKFNEGQYRVYDEIVAVYWGIQSKDVLCQWSWGNRQVILLEYNLTLLELKAKLCSVWHLQESQL